MTQVQERSRLQSYFDGTGFERLSAIYGDEECAGFRRAVREGHGLVVQTVVSWVCPQTSFEPEDVLDAGCGTGALSIPLAQAGACVDGIDFSHRMIATAKGRARQAGIPGELLSFAVRDLESIDRPYDTIVCIDVLARYSTEASVKILRHLSSVARRRLILTFTPKTAMDYVWHAIGAVYARRQGAVPLYTHRRGDILKALESFGWTICRETRFSAGFRSYFCRLLEARRIPVEEQEGAKEK